MRYRAIARQQPRFAVRRLCGLLGVSPSGYYAWSRRGASQRQQANQQLIAALAGLHQQLRGRYGSPRLYRELRGQGHACSENRVARLMRQQGIMAKRTIRFRTLTKAGTRGGRLRIFSIVSLPLLRPTKFGLPISVTSRPGKGICIWRWCWICSVAGWSVGRWLSVWERP